MNPPQKKLSIQTQNLASKEFILTPLTLQSSPLSSLDTPNEFNLRQELKLKNKIILNLMLEQKQVTAGVKDLFQELLQIKASVEQNMEIAKQLEMQKALAEKGLNAMRDALLKVLKSDTIKEYVVELQDTIQEQANTISNMEFQLSVWKMLANKYQLEAEKYKSGFEAIKNA